MLANEGQNGLLGDVSDGRLAQNLFSGGFGDPTDNIRDGFCQSACKNDQFIG